MKNKLNVYIGQVFYELEVISDVPIYKNKKSYYKIDEFTF